MSSFIFVIPHDSVDTVDQAAPGINAIYTGSLKQSILNFEVFISSFIFVIPHDSVYTVLDTVDTVYQAAPGMNANIYRLP